MKRNIRFCIFLAAWILILPVSATVWGGTYTSSETPGFIKVLGTSTLHDWHAESHAMKGQMIVEEINRDSLDSVHISSLTFSVQTSTLKSDKEGLDKRMYDALETDDHPEISFTLTAPGLPLSEDGETSDSSVTHTLPGTLTITGEERPVTLPVDLSRTESGALTLKGSYTLDMTDWNIKPPKLMMGAIKVGPEVTVEFEWILTPEVVTP